jgi:hypothetical protein
MYHIQNVVLTPDLCVVPLNKYYAGDQIKKNEMGGARSTYGEMRGAYTVLVGKPDSKRTPGRLRHKWKNNIKMDVQD